MIIKKLVSFLLIINSLGLLAQSDEIRQAIANYQYSEALEMLDNEPPERDNLLLMADCYEKLYNNQTALEIYKQLTEEYPDDPTLMIASAESAIRAGDSKLSLHYWVKADSLRPESPFIQTQKTLAYYRNSNWDETIKQAKIVFDYDSVPMLLRIVGDALLQTKYTDSARMYYLKALEKNPADHLSVLKLGGIYVGNENYLEAIDLTEDYLVNVNPDRQLIGQLNGVAHYSVGNYKEAVDRLKYNVELGDSSYTTCYYLGMSYYARKLYTDAITWLEKAYYHQTPDVNLLYYFGTSLTRGFDRNRGIEILGEGVAKIVEMEALLYDFDCSFADAYLRSQNYSKAIEYYKSAYKRRGDAHHQMYNIAYSYDLMGSDENAITYYKRFLETQPDNIEDFLIGGDAKYYIAAKTRLERLLEKQFFQSGES